MATRIAVMNEGRIEQVGSPHEIYHRPKTAFVADFIGESNFIEVTLDGDRVRGPGGVELPAVPGAGSGAATLMVRPEHVTVTAGAASGLPATIVKTAFLGSYLRVATNVEGVEAPVVAWLYGAAAGALTAPPGDHVTLTWDSEDVVVFRPDVPTTEGGEA